MRGSALADQLHHIAPQTEVLTGASDLSAFALDGSQPQAVVLPGTVEDVAAIVKFAAEQRLAALPCGGGTELGLGQQPERYDLALCTLRLNALLEHEAADLTCSVQAGMTLSDLEQRVGAKGQFLALDPPNPQRATIGGILAANSSGPARLRYGAARDLVIGLKVVLGDGTIARSGGRVVKNVAGYDLNKLYIGSLGTLRVIVEANFKLLPLPEHQETLLIAYDSAEAAMQTVMALLSAVVTPTALDLLDHATLQQLPAPLQSSLPGSASGAASGAASSATSGPAYMLAVSFSGGRKAVARQFADTRAAASRAGGAPGASLEAEAHQAFWEGVRAQQAGPLTCKVSLLLNDVAPFLKTTQAICEEQHLEASALAHAGSGVVYLQLRPTEAVERLAAAIGQLRAWAVSHQGALVIARAPTALKQQIGVWGEARATLRLMQQLKQQFDPHASLVRGRFVGGI
jgi:glycolate oxidase FAD binding subunit